VYQLQQLYRRGELDDCTGRWGALWACMALKAKPDAAAEARLAADAAPPCMWRARAPADAAAFWRAEFPGATDAEPEPPQAAP
jgi:hypothetical protein